MPPSDPDGTDTHPVEGSLMRMLVVEDEPRIASLLKRGLTQEGHAVDVATDGETAFGLCTTSTYDAIVLDVILPGISGLVVCSRLRQRGITTPILLLTARDSIADRVTGLDAGADDYLVKPFAFAELNARLRALVRRPRVALSPVLRHGTLSLDPSTRLVTRDGVNIALSKKEFRILEYLMRQPEMVHTRAMIADHVWDYDFPNVTNVIDVHIRQLRRKLDDPYPGTIIQTVRGVGYRLGSAS